MTRRISRRRFVQVSTGAAVTSALMTTMGALRSAPATAKPLDDYRAIVCVFLYGGNDGFNWFVPLSPAGYATYVKSRTNLALAANELLPLKGVASDNGGYGIHPSCQELQALFNSDKLAVLCNVGTLIHPTTPGQAAAGMALPPQLFSHIDQQTLWQTGVVNSPKQYGWAGRLADLYKERGVAPELALNINLGAPNYWQQGFSTAPYTLGLGGAPVLDDTSNTNYRGGERARAANALLNQAARDNNLLVRNYASIQRNAATKVNLVTRAFSATGNLQTTFPRHDGDNDLGVQLSQVARVIKARELIGDSRQVFFVSIGGFDTHNNELPQQAMLLRILSQNLAAFWSAMTELGTQDHVTLFTASDFGRTLGSNSNGADHAWGSHHVVLGGAVRGGTYYGKMPNLVIGGPDDFPSGRGQIIPSTSTDQYAATLARWFGVDMADINRLFPSLSNFASPTLAFMG